MTTERLPIPLVVLVGLILAAGLVSAIVAQEVAQDGDSAGRIVLDIPVRTSRPEDSKEHVTIVVRGMMKSRSGAT